MLVFEGQCTVAMREREREREKRGERERERELQGFDLTLVN
jgi:hypothetical protein